MERDDVDTKTNSHEKRKGRGGEKKFELNGQDPVGWLARTDQYLIIHQQKIKWKSI